MAVITASPKSLGRLIELQETANENLRSIRSIIELSRTLDSAPGTIKTLSGASRGTADESIIIEKETLETQKEMLQQMKEDARARAEDAADIAKLAQGVTAFKSIGEKLRDGFGSFKSKFSPDSLRKSFLSATNIGGINTKRLAREDFIQQQKSLGVQGSRAELKERFEGAQTAAKNIQSNEAEFEKLKKSTGLNEEQLGKTERGRELLQRREQASAEYSKFDARAGLVATGPMAQASMTNIKPVTSSTAAQNATQDKEAQIENSRLMNDQTEMLRKIEENTRSDSTSQKAKEASGDGGGLFSGIGAGLKGLGAGLRGLMGGAGKGIAVFLQGIARGLTSIGRAVASLGGSVGTGLLKFLTGFARGVSALANPKAIIGLTAFTLAMMGLGKALQFAAPAIEAFAPVLMKVAEVIGGVFIAVIEKIPETVRAVGEVVVNIIRAISDSITGIIDAVTGSIERLAAIDGSNLLAVGAGLVAVAGGLIAFSAAQVGAGIGNLVSGLFSKITGQKTPVEQLEQIAGFGPNLEKAGIGVEKLGGGLQSFSSIDAAKIKAISTLPVEKIAAMGATMQTPAAKVAASSAQNQTAKLVATSGNTASTSVVNAPVVNNTTRQTNVVKVPVRNTDNSVSSWLGSRYSGNKS